MAFIVTSSHMSLCLLPPLHHSPLSLSLVFLFLEVDAFCFHFTYRETHVAKAALYARKNTCNGSPCFPPLLLLFPSLCLKSFHSNLCKAVKRFQGRQRQACALLPENPGMEKMLIPRGYSTTGSQCHGVKRTQKFQNTNKRQLTFQ